MNKKDLGLRLVLVVFGFILPFLMVEAGLRIVGGLLLTARETRNRRDIFREGTYRILCLGESTTQEQWPPPLEKELNKNNRGIKFKVIDKGQAGASSAAILSRLEEYLDAFNPHMVVVMMGINDGAWVWKNPVEYEEKFPVKAKIFLKSTRINKLVKFVAEGLKNQEPGRGGELEQGPLRDKLMKGERLIDLGDLYREKDEHEKAKKMYEAGLRADPKKSRGYIGLGALYRQVGEYEKAKRMYEAGQGADPHNPQGYIGLGNMHRERGEYEKAKRMYEAGLKADPKNSRGYIGLGSLYHGRGEYEKAKRMYEAGLKADPQNPDGYFDLGGLYRDRGEYEKMKKMYEAGLKADPQNPPGYVALGRLYRERGEYEKAEEVLKKGYATTGAPSIAGALSVLYFQQGKKNLEQEYRRISYLPRGAIRNYQKLRDHVLRRGVKLVCMQYPMRDAEALEKILGTEKGIIYVENKKNFSEAVKTHKLTAIFRDMFQGDFGHCTEMGNRIIAKNLSKIIMQEVSGE